MTEDTALRIATALERIAMALEVPAALASTADVPVGCAHPPEMRVDFSGMGEADGFQCKACGAFVKPQKAGAEV